MSRRLVSDRLTRRLRRSGVDAPPALVTNLDRYLAVLARWNRRINLTSLSIDPLTDAAVDRLIVEPLIAARELLPTDQLAIDIGSGGGSPAIPMRLVAPWLRFVLVEVKVRKAAFLREVVRELGLGNVEVENRQFQELLARRDLHEAADVVTLRAVRGDRQVWQGLEAVLRPAGRVLWFTTADRKADMLYNLIQSRSTEIGSGTRLLVLHRVRS